MILQRRADTKRGERITNKPMMRTFPKKAQKNTIGRRKSVFQSSEMQKNENGEIKIGKRY